MSSSPVHKLHCLSYGVPFCLQSDSAELLSAMELQVPFGTEVLLDAAGEAPVFALQPGYHLQAGLEAAEQHPDLTHVLARLREMLMVHVANHAPDRIFLHAGVVGWRGRALVLPGASFAGKTTLVAALAHAGATYYSDEYAVIDADGCVHPYARHLQMREPGRPEQHAVPIEALQATAGTGPLRVAQVVLAQFVSGAHWSPQAVSPGMAVLEMLRHTIPVQRTPARVMATLARMVEGAQIVRSARGEASATAAALLAALI